MNDQEILTLINNIENNNLKKIKEIVNIENCNYIINKRLKWCALHYALLYDASPAVIKYLYEITNSSLKDKKGNDFKQFAINHNNITYFNIIEDKMKSKNYLIELLQKKCDEIIDENKKLNNVINKQKTKYNEIKNDYFLINEDFHYLKKKNILLEDENEKINKNNNKLKRKLDETETSFENILKKTKK